MVESPAAAGGQLPLSALLSQALVAFTIEFDNEFEHRMPHRTSNHGFVPGGGLARLPWLVSMAMWGNCARWVPPDGVPLAELARRARISDKAMQATVKRMSEWWGYLVVAPDPADARATPPRSSWLVRPTRAGQLAQEVWGPLTGVVEQRWHERFDDGLDRLRGALVAVVAQLDVELPDSLTIGDQAQWWRAGQPSEPIGEPAARQLALPELLSKTLETYRLDFERRSEVVLAVAANVLRVLDPGGVPVRRLTPLCGIARMGVDNSLSLLTRLGYASVGAEPAGGRHKVAWLTTKGVDAQGVYPPVAGQTEEQWAQRFGADHVAALRQFATAVVGDGSPLLPGLQPYPAGWRSQVPHLETLPHFPMVSHRGGFPDGS